MSPGKGRRSRKLAALLLVAAAAVLGSGASAAPDPETRAKARSLVAETLAAYAVSRNAAQAEAGYAKARDIDPAYLPALVGVALMRHLQIHPNTDNVYYHIVTKSKPGPLADFAKAQFESLRVAHPGKYDRMIADARLYWALGQLRLAAERADAARKLDDSRWEAYAVGAQVAQAANLPADARTLLELAAARASSPQREKLAKAAASLSGKRIVGR